MLFTGGGALGWWIVDAFRLEKMLAAHDAEQERRRQAGLPPLELSFMPPLEVDVLREPRSGSGEAASGHSCGWGAICSCS